MIKIHHIYIFILFLSMCGCDNSVGDVFHISISECYFNLDDAERGGAESKFRDLVSAEKATWIKDCGVKVLKPGPEWTKVEVINSLDKGVTGWIETSSLKK